MKNKLLAYIAVLLLILWAVSQFIYLLQALNHILLILAVIAILVSVLLPIKKK